MTHKYPTNLYEDIKKNWERKRWAKEKVPQLPDKEITQNIIDVVYHASLLTEEARRLWFRVIYIDPKEIRVDRSFSETNRILFDSHREFTVGELIKLVPAADPTQVLIGVNKKKNSNKLQIWGLIEAGTSWWNFLRHESSHGSPPPNGLTVSSKEPGHITISRQGEVLLALKGGKLYEPSDRVLYKGPISDFLEKSSSLLHKDACKKIGSKYWDKEGHDEDYPKRFYLFFLERILNKIREMHHGGTVIIVPDYFSKEDTRRTDRITIKYPCEYNRAWNYLIDELVRDHKYYDLHFKLDKQETISNKEYDEVDHLSYMEEYTEENISNAVGFISALSGVDGAIVMTDKLRLLGFGAEIIATSLSLKKVKVITDVRKNKGEYNDIDLFGTRHRSALRFCSSFEDCIIFIVSQDGDIRVAKRVGAEVTLWSDINIGSISF